MTLAEATVVEFFGTLEPEASIVKEHLEAFAQYCLIRAAKEIEDTEEAMVESVFFTKQ